MERVKTLLNNSANLKKTVAETLSSEILDAAQKIQGRLKAGGKLMLMGNGGSAATASHFANDLAFGTNDYEKPFKVMSITDNTAVLTALGNDYGYEEIFVTFFCF